MISPKEVLVVTTSGLDGLKIVKYLKPVSSHVVAGTNVFSDFAASFTDFFGGRSDSYQKQLSSIYDEAIEHIKVAAFAIGANCVVGLKVDMDEISGKSKSMFMVTVVGTAVIVENLQQHQKAKPSEQNNGVVSADKVARLMKRNAIVKAATSPQLEFTDETWTIIGDEQIEEVFPTLLTIYEQLLAQGSEKASPHYSRILAYLNAFPLEKKTELLYLTLLRSTRASIVSALIHMIKDLQMLDLKFVQNVLANDEYENKKKVLRLMSFQKAFYTREDIYDLDKIKELIPRVFKEEGTRHMKKGLLSSREKEVWTCKCGTVNDVNEQERFCGNCHQDIYGFSNGMVNPVSAIGIIDERKALISHLLNN